MKYTPTIFFFLFYLTFNSYTQDKVDSLQYQLKDADGKEKTKIYLALAEANAENNFEESINYSKEALNLAQKQKDKQLIAKSYQKMGQSYYYDYQNDKAIEYYKKSLDILKEIDDKKGMIFSLNHLGLTHYFNNDFSKSKSYLEQAIALNKNDRFPEEKAFSYRYLGRTINKTGDAKKAMDYYKKALGIYQDIDSKKGIAGIRNSIGLIYFGWDQYDSAIAQYKISAKLRETSGDQKGAGIALVNTGNVYWRWGKYDQAISNYQEASKIFEEIGFKNGIASCLNNIGLIYENLTKGSLTAANLKNFKKAMQYHQEALKVRKELGDQLEIAHSLNNIGTVHIKIQENKLKEKFGQNWRDSVPKLKKEEIPHFHQARENYQEAYNLFEDANYKAGIAKALNNLGRVHAYLQQNNKALQNLERALQISKELNNQYELAVNYFQIGIAQKQKGNYQNALEKLNKALDIANRNNLNEFRKSAYENISEIYEAQNNYQSALHAHKRFIDVRDSIFNQENAKFIEELQTKYQTDKKEQEIKILNQEQKLNEQQIRQQRLFLYGAIVIVIVIGGFLLLVFRQNNQIKKAYQLLEERNTLISKQKEEITDSIHYASRIQRAVLPQTKMLEKNLNDFFILWRPRDIVSGDFYWFTEHQNKLIIVTADCTGHGVPGAFMSMLGVSFLNEILSRHKEVHAEQILNELRDQVINSLHQTGKTGESSDGMDLALYIMDRDNMKLEYAGANNPLVIIRNKEIIQYKADKMPIGIYIKADIPFKRHDIDIQEGDCIYTFSDGYQDQFGGKGKKFMIKRMKSMLLENHDKPMTEQKALYDKTIVDWMGEEFEQIDDILLVGVRV